MKIKKVFKHSILRVNDDGSLSVNKHELNTTLRIIRDDKKEYSVVQEKLQILEDKIDECIKKHHDESTRDHSGVSKMLQLLQHSCQFFNMRQHVEIYIKRCLSCQQNKHGMHAKYDEIQYQTPSESP